MQTRPLDEDWRGWLRLNRDRGCDRAELFEKAARQGFDPREISAELDGFVPPEAVVSTLRPDLAAGTADGRREPWYSLYHAPLTRPVYRPRAWRLDTDVAQLYEIPQLLTPEECAALIAVIDTSLMPSTVTRGPADYRTSRTCHMRRADSALVKDIDARIATLIGVGTEYSEPIQGQSYGVGQYFKAHTDWFAPDTEEFKSHTEPGGQRTWTVMIYLNHVEEGGGTRFERVGRDFYPIPGLAVAWNNLGIDGAPNHGTLHEALPVLRGAKYVITKWFRETVGRNG